MRLEQLQQEFIERQLREARIALAERARMNFIQHRARNPSHRAWQRKRASGIA